MKRLLIFFLALLLNAQFISAQTVQDLNKAAKRGSGNRPYAASSSGASNDAFAAFMLVRSIVWMGQGFIQLGREQVRLARRNREDNMNHLYCLDLRPQAGYGLTGFVRLQPQIRANVGWFSLDLKQIILQDASDEFKSMNYLFWLNLVNREKFRLRAGIGSLRLNTVGAGYLHYALGAEFVPSPAIRIELEAAQSEGSGTERPLREIQLRAYHPFWTKSILQASVFGGASSQRYFGNLEFTTLDAGLNFRISASRFRK
jgi:hypothetical protein